jgi:hypothetical protein
MALSSVHWTVEPSSPSFHFFAKSQEDKELHPSVPLFPLLVATDCCLDHLPSFLFLSSSKAASFETVPTIPWQGSFPVPILSLTWFPTARAARREQMSYDKEVEIVTTTGGGGVSNVDHQRSLSERRRAALEEVDNAKFSRFHVKACAVAGVGFFTDAYDSEFLEGQAIRVKF